MNLCWSTSAGLVGQHSLLSLAMNSTLACRSVSMLGNTQTLPSRAKHSHRQLCKHVGWRRQLLLPCTAPSHVTEAWRRPLIAEYCVRDGILLIVVPPLLAARSSVCRTGRKAS